MNTFALLLYALQLTAIYAAYIVFKTIYKKSILDNHRAQLFSYRSELYDLAASGKIEPTHPAYRHVESHINTLLRFSHKTTTIRILYSMFVQWIGWYKPKEYSKYIDGVGSIPDTKKLPEPVTQKLVQLKRESLNVTVKHLRRYSPIWILVKPVLTVIIMVRVLRKSGVFTKAKNLDARVISREYDFTQYGELKGIA